MGRMGREALSHKQKFRPRGLSLLLIDNRHVDRRYSPDITDSITENNYDIVFEC